ncbi:MAG: SDR family NAD(P)-dependent oxidoreductase [Rhizobiaceae bacterium]|nr:SDR family NAD(P)-dependent oxidoreductase [Rhizobiaceae bacterium]
MSQDEEHRGVAIIGMACRFPGANSPEEFWENLCNGVDSISHFSDDQLLKSGVSPRDIKRSDYVKASPVIEGIDQFDAGFFEYSPREARLMDPQQRLLLEVAWHGFEDAGYIPGELDRRVGAFVGSGGVVSSYLLAQSALHGGATGGVEHLANDKDFLSTKLSYKLGLTGPSVNVQTACSTAMVAVHLACQSILDGECEMAVAGSSVVRVPHIVGYTHRAGDILSPDGKCRAYDAAAEGTVFGSGAGIVVLKHVEDALADGDCIYAVILGSAVNNDGGQKMSYTASSTEGQVQAMTAAFAAAEVPPSTIGYVEGHGTGTVVGDPLEVEALRRCFASDEETEAAGCYLGSVKTNIGHLEQAAGVASLIKTCLSLYHRKIPESLNFSEPNPRMDLAKGPFVVPTETVDWNTGEAPKRAAINSLGLGGTNAFAILQEAPKCASQQAEQMHVNLLAFSANSPEALSRSTMHWQERLAGCLPEELPNICLASATTRKSMKHRLAASGRSANELIEALALKQGQATQKVSNRKLAFLFPGQGAQTLGMARQFYDSEIRFRTSFDQVASRLLDRFGLDIKAAIFDNHDADVLTHTSMLQPALFAVELGLADMLQSWGIQPDAVLGHSVGAFAAAVVSGIYTPEAAADLIAERARLMGQLPSGGAMAALFGDLHFAEDICRQVEGVSIATINSPLSTVIAGDEEAIATAMVLAEEGGVACRQLPVSHAFHSRLMEPAARGIETFAADVEAEGPTIPFVSDLTGQLHTDELDGAYLARHILSPVRFADAVQQLLELGCTDFIEVGPGTALRSFVSAGVGEQSVELHGILDQAGDDWAATAKTLCRLWEKGYPLDLKSYYGTDKPPRISIPKYPFDHQSYWLDQQPNVSATAPNGLCGEELKIPGDSHCFQTRYSISQPGWLADHKVYGEVTLPVAAALLAFMEAAVRITGTSMEVGNLTYREACLIGDGEATQLNFDLPKDLSAGTAKLQSLADDPNRQDDWRVHCEASIAPFSAEPRQVADLEALRRLHQHVVLPQTYYSVLDQLGLNYGPGFKNVRQLWVGDHSALANINLSPNAVESDAPMHPAILDACLHLFPAATGDYGDFSDVPADQETTYLPITVERFAIYKEVPAELWSHCKLRQGADQYADRHIVDVEIYAEDGSPVASLTGLTVKMLAREEFFPAGQARVEEWLYGVDWRALDDVSTPSERQSARWLIVCDSRSNVEPLLEAMDSSVDSWSLITPDVLLQNGGEGGKGDEGGGAGPSFSQPSVDGIVLATSLSCPPLALLNPESLTGETQRQFEVSQAALKLAIQTAESSDIQPRIWYLTRGAQAPSDDHLGGEAIQSVLWGHGRAIAQEHPNVWGGMIDIDARTSGAHILREMQASDGEDQLVLRDGKRFAPRLVRREFDEYTLPVNPPIRPDASYLITGGLGALGLKVADWLVSEHGARAIWLVSRRQPSPEQQQTIGTLEELGARVHIVSADITEQQQVNSLIADITQRGPALDGVFHCAGLLDDGIMIEMGWQRYHRVTNAKIEGSWALHLAVEHLQLGHFVLFSSILSVIGSMGQLNYVSGNSFQDGLASYRRRLGLSATAMNWGPWENVGLAVESGERGEAIWRARGTKFIPADIGLEAMSVTLAQNQEHMVVTHTDWDRFVSQFANPPKLYAELSQAGAGTGRQILEDLSDTMERLQAAGLNDRQLLLTAAVEQICCVNLEIDDLSDRNLSLREMGLDSLMSITVINDIESVFGVRLPARELLRGPSVNELADMVALGLPALFEPGSGANDAIQPTEKAAGMDPNGSDIVQTKKATGSWLVIQRPRPNARLRLFCFPFAGGGSAVFDNWGDAFNSDIEIVSVEAPGRLGRIDEEPVRTIEQFARGLYPELREKLDRPYAVLGHCLGGLTLYETLRFFQARHDLMPQHIFVSGARPPSVLRAPGNFEEELNQRLKSYVDYKAGRLGYQQPDEVFAEIVRAFGISESSKMLEEEELRQLVLPTVRAEFEMTSRYIYLPERPFAVPITCFRGMRDDYFRRVHASIWQKFTTDNFELFERDTGHFAIVEDFDFIRTNIEMRLLQADAVSA